MKDYEIERLMKDYEIERLMNGLEYHAKSQHIRYCSQCPYRDSEEEDEEGNYEGECTWLIAKGALELIKEQQKELDKYHSFFSGVSRLLPKIKEI